MTNIQTVLSHIGFVRIYIVLMVLGIGSIPVAFWLLARHVSAAKRRASAPVKGPDDHGQGGEKKKT